MQMLMIRKSLGVSRSRNRYRWTPGLDSILEHGYRKGAVGRRQAIHRICSLTGWPRQVCWDRARRLSFTYRRIPVPRQWSKTEEDRLQRVARSKDVRAVAAQLERTVPAVRSKLKRMKTPGVRICRGLTKTELAEFVGRSPKRVQQWIDQGWLKGRYDGRQRKDDAFRVTDRDFRDFWVSHGNEVPLHSWSRDGLEWFLSVLLAYPTTRLSAKSD